MSLHRTLALAAVAGGLAFTLPAAETSAALAAAPVRSCFYVNQISATRAADARTLYVRVSGKSIYRLDMKADCHGMRPPSETIVLEPTPSGQICSPLDVDITVGDHGTAQRCLVDTITKLTPEEVASLPKAVTP